MSTQPPLISVITPVYRGESSIEALYTRVKNTLETHLTARFEFIMVDDQSPDRAWPVIERLVSNDPRVVGVRLSRNFGQYMALTAGLDRAQGEWVIILDCDLQDVPEEIPKLYAKAQEGFDIVLAQRVERQDTFFKRFCSQAFHKVFSYLTETQQDPSTAQFGIYHRNVVQTLIGMRERLRYLPAFIDWIGFRVTRIPVEHAEREHGGSSYSFNRLLHLAFDTILAFSDKPLRLIVKLGVSIALCSLLAAITLVIRAWMGFQEPLGWTSLMVAISFFSGLMILIMGLNGLYIARIFDEVKGRPLYIVQQVCVHPSTQPHAQPLAESLH